MKTYWQFYDGMTIFLIGMLIITGVVSAINGDFAVAIQVPSDIAVQVPTEVVVHSPFDPNYTSHVSR